MEYLYLKMILSIPLLITGSICAVGVGFLFGY